MANGGEICFRALGVHTLTARVAAISRFPLNNGSILEKYQNESFHVRLVTSKMSLLQIFDL